MAMQSAVRPKAMALVVSQVDFRREIEIEGLVSARAPPAMCSVDAPKTNRAVAPRSAGRKRPLELAAAEKRAKAARLSARSRALVPFLARPLVAAAPRAEPSWASCLRERLELRLDLTMHFIGEKAVTATDLDWQQNRFRLPTDGVLHVLRPILFGEELDAAKIPRVGALEVPRAPKKLRPPQPTEELLQGKKTEKRTKKKGMKHDGLPVNLYNVHGDGMKLQLTRWKSSRAIVVKGEGYVKFIVAKCGFKKNDVVEIWAFKQREFRCFGARFLPERPLCVVLAKKEQQPAPAALRGMG